MNYIIIGNGIAGIHAAEAIRRLDQKGRITMIGDESFPPYCRPMISLVLEGSIAPEKLPVRPDSFYEKLDIHPLLGRRVTRIDVQNRKVFLPGELEGSETSFPYDRLLIASGADPRPVKTDGLDLKNLFYMRTQAHVRGMLDALPDVKNALVLGGGLVGFKAAYGLLHRGIHVTMLIRSGYPLSMQVDEPAGKMILDELIRKGLEVKVGVEVKAFEGNGSVQRAALSDGSELACDMAVIGKGVLPAHSFVPRDSIDIDLGIMVNGHMETSVPGIFAAGDVAEYVDIARRERWVNAIWPEAVTQGQVAGTNMAGRPFAYKGSLGRNVIRIFDMDVMTGGLVNPPDDPGYETIFENDHRRNTYRKFVFREDRLVGMVMVNDVEQGGLMLSMIQNEQPLRIEKEMLLDSTVNVSRFL